MKTCVTHHRCDCTQAKLDELESRLAWAEELLKYAHTVVFYDHEHSSITDENPEGIHAQWLDSYEAWPKGERDE